MNDLLIYSNAEKSQKSRLLEGLKRLSNNYLREVLILEETLMSKQTKEVEDEKSLLEKMSNG